MTAIRPRNPVAQERQLRAAVRRFRDRSARLEEAVEERDEAVREARAAGLSQAEVMEITGLSRPRINQIVRGTRL